MANVERIAGTRVVHVVLQIVIDETVVRRVVDAPEGDGGPQVIALGRVVVDHVEDDLDSGVMQCAHHAFELEHLLTVVADKVHRDQSRMGDMRRNLISTQKELKRLREVVLESDETPISVPVHDALDKLITTNRRVNYRVEPPKQLPCHLRLDSGKHLHRQVMKLGVAEAVRGGGIGAWRRHGR